MNPENMNKLAEKCARVLFVITVIFLIYCSYLLAFMAGVKVGKNKANNTHEMIDRIMNEGLQE
jgi:hypothetical protein